MTVGGIPTFFMIGGSMQLDQNNITSTINKYLLEENLELYDINIVNFPNISKIEVFVYSSFSLDYKTIERLNFQIQRLLEEFNIQKGTYDLIVSSPGIERKLKTKRHFELSVDELVKIKLIEPITVQHAHSKTEHYLLEGYINSVGDNHITISSTSINPFEQNFNIEISNIKNAKIEFKQFKERIKG